MSPLGTYTWTASAAGWCVLAWLTGLPEAWITAALCAGLAWLWSTMTE